MRTIAIVALAVILAAVLVSGIVLYQRHRDTRDALLMSEKTAADLELKVSQLNSKTSDLHDQLRESSERIQELEGAQAIISELEHVITEKEKIIRTLQKDLKQESDANEYLSSGLASKEASLAELQEQLNSAHSHIRSLKGELADTREELRGLKTRLSNLTGEKTLVETEMDRMKSTYESLIADLKEQIERQEVSIKGFEEEISVTFVDRILFDSGKAAITSEGRTILNKIGEALQTVRGRKIRVVGHTDDRPIHPDYRFKFSSNWELSSARASAVVRFLQEEIGFNPISLEAVGRSFYDPLASNETAEGRAKNRRVEIIIAPQLE
jgi:chemotaxis protein MotB